MKKLLIFTTLILYAGVLGFASDPVTQGKTDLELGAFIVEKSYAPIIVDARILPTYEVIYENSSMTVRIAIDNSDRKCRKYIVVSDNLAIQYNCDGKVFGASLLDENYVEDGISNSRIYLNNAEYFKQKVLTQIQKSELEHIELISVFFPRLIKDYDRVFAIK